MTVPNVSEGRDRAVLERLEASVAPARVLDLHVDPDHNRSVFTYATEDADALLEAWEADAGYMKQRPGFISTQLHRGVAGSSVFLNYAVWESVEAFRAAFTDPQFRAGFARYPDSTVASPHLFQKVAVPGICVDR